MRFFLVFAALAVLWSVSIALMGAPDEPAHTLKAVAVGRGELDTAYTRQVSRGFLVMSIPITPVRVPSAYASTLGLTRCWLGTGRPASCAPKLGAAGPTVRSGTYVGTYPPLYYALVGWTARVTRPYFALYAMRVLGGLMCAALFAWGFTVAARLGPMTLLGGALGLTPMVLFLMGAINPNGLEIAAAFCLWAAVLELGSSRVPPGRSRLVWATIAAVVLAGTRPLSPAFLAVILVVGLLAADREALRQLARDRGARIAGVVVGVVALVDVAFVLANDSLDAFIQFGGAPTSRTALARAAYDLTGTHLRQAVGVLGWIGPGQVNLPRLLLDAWIVAVLALVVAALILGAWRGRVIVVLLIVGGLGLPIVSQATSASGASWQGRYALPILVAVPLFAGLTIDRSRRVPVRVVSVLVGGAGVAIALAYGVAHQLLMTRNLVGVDHALFDGLTSGRWNGPGTPVLLFVVAVVVSVAYGVLLWHTALHPPVRTGSARDALAGPSVAPSAASDGAPEPAPDDR